MLNETLQLYNEIQAIEKRKEGYKEIIEGMQRKLANSRSMRQRYRKNIGKLDALQPGFEASPLADELKQMLFDRDSIDLQLKQQTEAHEALKIKYGTVMKQFEDFRRDSAHQIQQAEREFRLTQMANDKLDAYVHELEHDLEHELETKARLESEWAGKEASWRLREERLQARLSSAEAELKEVSGELVALQQEMRLMRQTTRLQLAEAHALAKEKDEELNELKTEFLTTMLQTESTATDALNWIWDRVTVDADGFHLPPWAPIVTTIYYNPPFLRTWSKLAMIRGCTVPDEVDEGLDEGGLLSRMMSLAIEMGAIEFAMEDGGELIYIWRGKRYSESGETIHHCDQ